MFRNRRRGCREIVAEYRRRNSVSSFLDEWQLGGVDGLFRLTAACEAFEAALARLSAEPTTAERRDTMGRVSTRSFFRVVVEGRGDVPAVETAVALLLLRGRRGGVLHLQRVRKLHVQRGSARGRKLHGDIGARTGCCGGG